MATINDLAMGTCQCAKCGITFAVPLEWQRNRRNDHKTFYCPNGHPQWYPSESDAERLEREKRQLAERLDHERQCCIAAHEKVNHVERRLWGMKGQLARVKNQMKQRAA